MYKKFILCLLIIKTNCFILHKPKINYIIKNSFDDMPSSSEDYYTDDWYTFKSKIDNVVESHNIIKSNNFTNKFKQGMSFDKIRFFIQQYSIFYNSFLETKLKKINNVNDIQDSIREKEILLNELGVIYNGNNVKIKKQKLKTSEINILKKNGFLLMFSELTGAVTGIILKISVSNSNFFIGYSIDDDNTFRLNNNLYSYPKGTIEGGTFKFEASQFEWIYEIGKKFNLKYNELGKKKYATNETLFLCDNLEEYYSNNDESTLYAAEYIMNYWKNTNIWDDIIIGFKKYNKDNNKYIPLIYWFYNKKLNQTFDLKEKFDYNKIEDQEMFLKVCKIMLDSLEIFWNGLI